MSRLRPAGYLSLRQNAQTIPLPNAHAKVSRRRPPFRAKPARAAGSSGDACAARSGHPSWGQAEQTAVSSVLGIGRVAHHGALLSRYWASLIALQIRPTAPLFAAETAFVHGDHNAPKAELSPGQHGHKERLTLPVARHRLCYGQTNVLERSTAPRRAGSGAHRWHDGRC